MYIIEFLKLFRLNEDVLFLIFLRNNKIEQDFTMLETCWQP